MTRSAAEEAKKAFEEDLDKATSEQLTRFRKLVSSGFIKPPKIALKEVIRRLRNNDSFT